MVATLAGYTQVSLSYVIRKTKVWLRHVFLGYVQYFLCKDYEQA